MGLCHLPLACLLVAGAPRCPMPCSPNSQFNSVSGPPSSLKHVPPPSPWASFRSGAHLCASAPIFQGACLCASAPIFQGPISVPQAPHCLRAPLCSGFLATLPLCCLLAAPPCLGLPPPQGPLSPSPLQVAECSLPALPISCLLPPFLEAHLFTVGRAEDPRGTAFPARVLERSGGTRLQWWWMCGTNLMKGPHTP